MRTLSFQSTIGKKVSRNFLSGITWSVHCQQCHGQRMFDVAAKVTQTMFFCWRQRWDLCPFLRCPVIFPVLRLWIFWEERKFTMQNCPVSCGACDAIGKATTTTMATTTTGPPATTPELEAAQTTAPPAPPKIQTTTTITTPTVQTTTTKMAPQQTTVPEVEITEQPMEKVTVPDVEGSGFEDARTTPRIVSCAFHGIYHFKTKKFTTFE